MGADVRIQQTRKAYFMRQRRRGRIEEALNRCGVAPVEDMNHCLDEQASIAALTLVDPEAAEQLEDKLALPEPRFVIREAYAEWLTTLEDTSLDDILTVCAVLKPALNPDGSLSRPLVPEYLLNSAPWGLHREVTEVTGFFYTTRDTSALEYRKSKVISRSTPAETIPTEQEPEVVTLT